MPKILIKNKLLLRLSMLYQLYRNYIYNEFKTFIELHIGTESRLTFDFLFNIYLLLKGHFLGSSPRVFCFR